MYLSFNYWNAQITSVYVANIPFCPTKKEAMNMYKKMLLQKSSLSALQTFKPKIAVLYRSFNGYKFLLSEYEINNAHKFPDQPNGTKSSYFKIKTKDLN